MPDINIIPSALNIDPYGILVGIVNALSLLFFVIIFAGLGIVIWKKKMFVRFPTKFEIMKVENGVLSTIDEDFGRRVVKKERDGSIKELYYDIKKRGFKWFPPTYETMIPTKKGKSKIYVKELSHNNWEMINPKDFVTGKHEDYSAIQTAEVDDFFKNTQDDLAEVKWAKGDKWQKLINALPALIAIFGIAIFIYIFGQYLVIPLVDRGIGVSSQSTAVLEKATQVLDTSMRYMEHFGIMPLNNYNNTTVIP